MIGWGKEVHLCNDDTALQINNAHEFGQATTAKLSSEGSYLVVMFTGGREDGKIEVRKTLKLEHIWRNLVCFKIMGDIRYIMEQCPRYVPSKLVYNKRVANPVPCSKVMVIIKHKFSEECVGGKLSSTRCHMIKNCSLYAR